MDSDPEDNFEEELDDKLHKRLVKHVLSLSHKEYVKAPSRTEPSLTVSEYDLAQTNKKVHLQDLALALKKKGKHLQVSKQIGKLKTDNKPVPKPLEKIKADRIHRTVGYEKTKQTLNKWDPIVTSLRAATHVSYPLHSKKKRKEKENLLDEMPKTELQLKLESINKKCSSDKDVMAFDGSDDGDGDDYPLTMQEMLEKRKEAAKFRAQESYKMAKARRQNKIKSKKYHRVERRQKLKEQIKDFELLQKVNPEAALEKLQEIERARAEERMSLRHKSTGQWAKSKLIRAKYDKESRQVLSEQLALSRDLTKKLQSNDDSDTDEECPMLVDPGKDQDNPWISDPNIKVSKEVEDFVSGYRKYWEQKNDIKEDNQDPTDLKHHEISGKVTSDKELPLKIQNNESASNTLKSKKNNNKAVRNASKEVTSNSILSKDSKELRNEKVKKKTSKLITKPQIIVAKSGIWTVTENSEESAEDDDFLDAEFDKLEVLMQKKIEEKAAQLKKQVKNANSKIPKPKKKSSQLKQSESDLLAIKKAVTRPVIDEELNETAGPIVQTDNAMKMSKIDTEIKDIDNQSAEMDVDPDKFIKINTTQLKSGIPDLMSFDDNEEDVDQKGLITEAFQDDDIVDNFAKDKQQEIDKDKPEDIDLTLPGWGCWGGKDIKPSVAKKKRFIVKFPSEMPRKDKNKGDLILSESGNAKIKPLLVSEVPFPFKGVKDFEASIRAPIGNTFVPETAFQRQIEPAIETRTGAIIEPMTDAVLLKKKKK